MNLTTPVLNPLRYVVEMQKYASVQSDSFVICHAFFFFVHIKEDFCTSASHRVQSSQDKYSFSYNSNVPDLKVSHHGQSMKLTVTLAVSRL